MKVGTFKITPQAFAVIMQGLGELPLKVSRPVHDELMQQAQALDAAQQAQQQMAGSEKPAADNAAVAGDDVIDAQS